VTVGRSGGHVAWGELLDDGRVGAPEALASVDELRRPSGDRALAVRVAGGFDVDVLLDRGLDLGAAWWAGTPLAWRSPHPVDPGPGREWEDRFLGGLLATCGPDNIGAPRDGHGQHGTHHLTPAHDVRWWRERDGDALEVHVRGAVAHTTLYGPRVVVEREIVVATGRPQVEVRDVVRNHGDTAVHVPLLYHVNLGSPVLVPGTRVRADADDPVPADPLPDGRDAVTFPAPAPGLAYVVAEHPDVHGAGDGWARASVGPTGLGRDVVVEWRSDAMPRLFTWLWPAAGVWVLGVEPANAPLVGPERASAGAGAPVLGPGESWACGLRVRVDDDVR